MELAWGFKKIRDWRKTKRLERIQKQADKQKKNVLVNGVLVSAEVFTAAIAFSSAVFSLYSEESGYQNQVKQWLSFPVHAYSAVVETTSLISSIMKNSQTMENGEEIGFFEWWRRKWNIWRDVWEFTGEEVSKNVWFLLRAKDNLSENALMSLFAAISVFGLYGALSYFIHTTRKGDGDGYSHKLRKRIARRYWFQNSELETDTIEEIEETLQLKISREEAEVHLLEAILHISEEEAQELLRDIRKKQESQELSDTTT